MQTKPIKIDKLRPIENKLNWGANLLMKAMVMLVMSTAAITVMETRIEPLKMIDEKLAIDEP